MYPKCSTKTEREKTFSAFRHARTDCPESAFVCFKHTVYVSGQQAHKVANNSYRF